MIWNVIVTRSVVKNARILPSYMYGGPEAEGVRS